jgi:hypothetical protein
MGERRNKFEYFAMSKMIMTHIQVTRATGKQTMVDCTRKSPVLWTVPTFTLQNAFDMYALYWNFCALS